jgi:alkanesulfonate monooxygenase SsuD/methylene tetrahydromethanopterin reductase-like flavin-dependent oxidoreductase (luciferase family)
MQTLTRQDLWSLEDYAERRASFRAEVIEHKRNRKVAIGAHATLYFEDRLTMQYQIQEMLRVERIFEASGINEELDAYNPMIPNGRNWKATFMIEYEDMEERRQALARLIGIEDKTWVRIGDHVKVYAIADEDLERTADDKTSSVHFMRFELSDAMAEDLKAGASLSMGIDHPEYRNEVQVDAAVRDSLTNDLD